MSIIKQTLHERSERLLAERMKKIKPTQGKFKFIFLGDSRGPDEKHFLGEAYESVLQQAVAKNPLFIIHGGDTVYRGRRPYLKHFVQVTKKIAPDIPVFVLVGNHDQLPTGVSNLENFRRIIGRVHFIVNVPRFCFRIIALNNIIHPRGPNTHAEYGFTPREIAYLKSQLNKNIPKNTVLAMHTPPAVGRWSTHGFPVNTATSKKFFDLLSRHSNKVKKVLVSHIHAYDEEFMRKNNPILLGRGIDYVLSGGAGAPIREQERFIWNGFHFVEFSVTKNRISSPDLWRVFSN